MPASFVGWYLALWGVFTFYMWIASFRTTLAVNIVFLLLWITFVVLGIGAALQARVVGRAPLPGHWKVFNKGVLVHEADGDTLEVGVESPGNHRVELWLDVAGRPLPWVLANPIYVE